MKKGLKPNIKQILCVAISLLVLFSALMLPGAAEEDEAVEKKWEFSQMTDAELEKDFEVLNPNEATLSLTDKGLTFSSCSGDLNGINKTPENIVTIYTRGDYIAEAHIALSEAYSGNAHFALGAYLDYNNFVKARFEGHMVAVSYANNSSNNGTAYNNIPSGLTEIWLRFSKLENTYSFYYSLDGTEFLSAGSVTVDFEMPRLMLHVGNNGSYDAVTTVDYLKYTRVYAEGEKEYDFKNMTQLPDELILRNPTEGGYTLTSEGIVLRNSIDLTGASEDMSNFLLAGVYGDYIAETKISCPTGLDKANQAYLVIYESKDNFVKLRFNSDHSAITSRKNASGDGLTQGGGYNSTTRGKTECWFRIVKSGNTYTPYYSLDGATFTTWGTPVTLDMEMPKIGLSSFLSTEDASFTYEYLRIKPTRLEENWAFSNEKADELRKEFTIVDGSSWSIESDGILIEEGGTIANGANTQPSNLFLREAGGNYIAEAVFGFDGTWNYNGATNTGNKEVSLIIYQDAKHFVKLQYTGKAFILKVADGATEKHIQGSQTFYVGFSTVWLRLIKEKDSYIASYSYNGTTYNEIATVASVVLSSPKVGVQSAGTSTTAVNTIVKSLSIVENSYSLGKELTVPEDSIRLKVSDTYTLAPTPATEGDKLGRIKFTSSHPSIITVSDSGVISAVGEGYAWVDIDSDLSGSCRVIVQVNPKVKPNTESSGNPYLPAWEFIPDAEPYVFEDPDNPGEYRVYIYGSHDYNGNVWCSDNLVTWSAPIDDLTNWRYEGVIFKTGQLGDNSLLFAPDVAVKTEVDGTKTYYLYPNPTQNKDYYRVAKSDRPDGPFVPCEYEMGSTADENILISDPAVFVDDDGKVYGYWGYMTSPMWAELDPDTMATIKEGTSAALNIPGISDIEADDYDPTKFNIVQDEHVRDWRFFEASSIRKVGDMYVFIYSRSGDETEATGNGTGQLAYGYSSSPAGPWTYGGVIVRCGGEYIKTGDSTTGYDTYPQTNTHGSICEINGQWFVFYHRGSLSQYSRQAMVEPITVDVTDTEVKISYVDMTSCGFMTDGLNPYEKYSASLISYFVGKGSMFINYDRATQYMPVCNINSGTVLGFKYFNLDKNVSDGKMTKLGLTVYPLGQDCEIDVFLRSPDAVGTPIAYSNGFVSSVGEGSFKIGTLKITADMAKAYTTLYLDCPEIDALDGKWGIFFAARGAANTSLCHIQAIEFCEAESNDNTLGKLQGYNLTLGGEIGLNFYMSLFDAALSADDTYVRFTVGGRTLIDSLDKSEIETVNGTLCYRFTALLAAKEMTETVTAQLISGESKGKIYSYSVREYADYIIENKASNPEYAAAEGLVRAMLDYGAASQVFFEYRTDYLANQSLTAGDLTSVIADTFKAYAITEEQGGNLVTVAGSRLSLESTTTLKLYLSAKTDAPLTFTYKGEELIPSVDGAFLCLSLTNITSKSLGEDVEITVTDGNETVTVRYNVFAYCSVVFSDSTTEYTDALKDTLRALYLYNLAAIDYFN